MNKNFKIAVASGKGGTGKTLLSTSLFHALQNDCSDICLVDCDAEEPNSVLFFDAKLKNSTEVKLRIPKIDVDNCTFCGKCRDYCSYNAIFTIPPAKIIKVIEELCHACGACTFACEHNAITEKEVVQGVVNEYFDKDLRIIEARMRVGVMSPVDVIKSAIVKAGDKGIVIFDSPPGTSCPFIHTVSRSDFVILITEPTPFGLSDLKQSIETLKTMDKKFGVVVNRAGLGNNDVYKYLNQNKIPLLMEIPFNREIARVYSEGKIVSSENSKISDSLVSMFTNILQEYGNSSN